MRPPLAGLLLLVCCHDWDKLDPRLGASGGGGGSGGGTSTAGQGPGGSATGAGSPCGDCPAETPVCDLGSTTCVECVVDTQCSGADECKDKECCVDDGVTCASDDDCCGSSQCQDSGACGELAGCKANDDDCNDDSDCCSDKCTGNKCRKD